MSPAGSRREGFRRRYGRKRGQALARDEVPGSLRSGFVQLLERLQALGVFGIPHWLGWDWKWKDDVEREICRVLRCAPPKEFWLEGLAEVVRDCAWDEFYEACEVMARATGFYRIAERLDVYREGVELGEISRGLERDKDQLEAPKRLGVEEALEGWRVFHQEVNDLLEVEGAPWRMKDGEVVPAFPEEAEEALDGASEIAQKLDRPGTAAHLRKARRLLRLGEPDLENAVKEAVSAIEAAVKEKSGSEHFDAGLRALKQQRRIGGHWSAAVQALYQYASQAPQIRHGGPALSELGHDEARDVVALAAVLAQHIAGLPDRRS